MAPDLSKPVTLCQACIKGKRRCEQRWPKCSRCLGQGRDCEYVSAPLTATFDTPWSSIRNVTQNRRALMYQIHTPLRLGITKEYDQSVIRFLISGLREYPRAFAKCQKTDFLHPDVYTSGIRAVIRDTNTLCKLHTQCEQRGNTDDILQLLRIKSDEIHRHISRSSTIDELLSCSQALIIIQCILALNKEPFSLATIPRVRVLCLKELPRGYGNKPQSSYSRHLLDDTHGYWLKVFGGPLS